MRPARAATVIWSVLRSGEQTEDHVRHMARVFGCSPVEVAAEIERGIESGKIGCRISLEEIPNGDSWTLRPIIWLRRGQ